MLSLPILILAIGAAPATATVPDHGAQLQRWERRLRRRVAELHVFPGGADKDWAGEVAVRFSIGADGRPENAVIQRSSGNPVFDRAARRLVRLLGPIGRVPSTDGRDRTVLLGLSYGAIDPGYRRTAASTRIRLDDLQL
jgi:TonB family protein